MNDDDPATEAAAFLNPWQLALARGRKLYDWQVETLEAFGRGYPVALVACNGSGKTTEIAGAAVDWFFHRYPRGWLVATSSSFNQLRNQTWAALETRLPEGFELRRGGSPLKLRAPRPQGNTTHAVDAARHGGEGVGFSTIQPGRAEGWHPKVSAQVDPVMILIDEGKTVPDAIWSAFDRCTAAYFLVISSPGPPFGRFYDCFHRLRKYYWTRRVTSAECPHIPAWKREKDREIHGEDSAVYRSMHLAEFTADGAHLICAPADLHAATLGQPQAAPGPQHGETVAFFDFARGGDENVFALRRGNTVRIVDAWREADSVQAVRRFIHLATLHGVAPHECWGDADGLGGPMCDVFKDQGFPIHEFHGGAAAGDAVNFANLISEVWIQGVRRLLRGDFHFGELDAVTKRQLCDRQFLWDRSGRKRAEGKDDMRRRGASSPDRADALLGCVMCGSHLTGAMTSREISSASTHAAVNPFATTVVGW